MVESTRAAIASINPELEAAARTLGSTELELLWRITLPLAYRGILAGFGLSVARGLGEFGATLMVCGSIPDALKPYRWQSTMRCNPKTTGWQT
jgi:molybdate transport system permease protein